MLVLSSIEIGLFTRILEPPSDHSTMHTTTTPDSPFEVFLCMVFCNNVSQKITEILIIGENRVDCIRTQENIWSSYFDRATTTAAHIKSVDVSFGNNSR